MKKQTIIMLHGFRGTHHGLELIAKSLPHFKSIIPDLPGFGEGDELDAYTLDAYVDWLKNFIKAQKLDTPPVLLGHSFGSILASAYAAKYPKTISKLVLINPIGAPALEGPRALWSKAAVLYYWTGSKLPKRAAHRLLASNTVMKMITITMMKTKDPEMKTFIYDQHRRYFSNFHSPESVAQGFKTSISHSVRDFAPSIKTSTVLIIGDRDDITSVSQQRELLELFPNADLNIIEKVGHLVHYEAPKEAARHIQEFTKLS